MGVMTQRDSLDESLRHLEYEMAMMVAAPRMLAKHQLTPAENTARPDSYFWANDRAVAYLAALESALTHARLLDDFFRYATGDVPTEGAKANDRYAAEYCVQKGWSGRRVLTPAEHLAIDRQLSHLTTQRRWRKPHKVGSFLSACGRRTDSAGAAGRYAMEGSAGRYRREGAGRARAQARCVEPELTS